MKVDELLKLLGAFYDQYKPSLRETHNGEVPTAVAAQGEELLRHVEEYSPGKFSVPPQSRWSDLLRQVEFALEHLYKS